MNRLTQKIVSYFLERGYITENQVEWCEYVVEQKLCAAFLLPIMIGVGCLIAPIWQVIVLNIGVYYLRSKTNGYYSKSIWGCLIFSTSCEMAALKVLPELAKIPVLISSLVYFVILFIIFLLAPINNEKIHYSENEMNQMKASIRIRLLVYSSVVAILYFIVPTISACLTMAMVVVAFLLVIAKLGFGVQ